ncbi:MAG TPA: glycosyltransferase family 2 protein [Thermoleophilaceae bacterium]
MKLSILMPVFNEEPTVDEAVRQVLATELPVETELVLVDDGSTDRTGEILRAADWPDDKVRIYHHERNQGKGAAVRTALEHAEGDIAAILDADLEYAPTDLAPLLEPLLEGETNVAFGVRAFNGYTSHSFLYVLGNRGVTLLANVLFNVYIGDLMTCHKVIRTDVFRDLPLCEKGFGIEPEITARLLQRGERIYEVPVSYRARSTEQGKKLTWVDGLRVVRTLTRIRFGG